SYPPPAVVEKPEEDRPAAIPPPTAIKAARIISVKPSEPQTPLATSPEPAATEPAVPRRDTPLDAMAAVVEEIPDEDIAPDSGEVTDDDIANEAELRDVDMDAEATPVSEPLSEDGKAKPTPPKPPPRPKREGREPMPTIG